MILRPVVLLIPVIIFGMFAALRPVVEWMTDPYMDDWWRLTLGMIAAAAIATAGLVGIALIVMAASGS